MSRCVSDFWIGPNDGTLKYIFSGSTVINSTTTKNLPQYIQNGWDYNATSGLCTREKGNNTLGLENNQYTYLMALTGLLVGFAFLFPLLNIISRGRS